ncbi:hypothetical protein HWU03_004532 [Vibrio parahaemolyticus]|nr:hypothetical protein [Vibrio parahaemolyticus]EJG0909027.1 hypothetical protein [Vibrio parahaemolyticus]EJG1749548.1 hypothetical protein [Vibrio parahaemolyticus]
MTEFVTNASLLSIALMVYAANVMMEALQRDRIDPHGLNTPLLIKSKMAAWFMFASIPCAFLPALYVTYYLDWKYGVISWIIQIIGAVITITFGLGGRFIAFHFIAACIAFPVGYYLCIADMVA